MRTSKAILLGSIVGLSASAYFLWPALLSKSELLLSLRENWPETLLIWLVAYGSTVVIFCVADVLRAPRGRWLRTYVLELGKAQYWTAAFMLLVLDLSHPAIAVDASLPPIFLLHPALTACAALILIGIIGALIATVGLALSGRHRTLSRDDNLEASLREMIASLQAQPSVARVQSSAEDWQKSMQGAVDALVRETSLLRAEVHTAVEELRASKVSGPTAQSEPTEVTMLHDAARSIEQSVPKLEQVVSSLSAVMLSAHQDILTASTGAIATVSSQLDELLRDVNEPGQMHS